MGEACFIIPTCRNKEGKDVESKLFEDLWKLSGNYEWAETQYKIATDQEFLDTVSTDAVYDSNGQITAKSFLDITGITFASDEIKKRLTERWEDKHLPTGEVSDKVSEFNSKEELKDDFVPVVEEEEGKVVKFTISQRSPSRVAALQQFIENNQILSVVSKRLQDLGVAYDFVGERERYGGRFSTKNAEKAYDGLYHLIEIADGGDVEATLLEESAHLATLACKDSIFINRLLDAINENTVEKLFTQEELAGVDLSSKDAKLELAGKLVAKAMKNELTEYRGLLANIKRMISRVFSGSSLASLVSAKARAQKMAEKLAHGFLYEDNMDVEEALKTPAELYSSKPITEEGKKLKSVLKAIRVLGSRVSTFSKTAYNDVYRQLSERDVLGEDDYASITATETVAHISAAVDTLLERLSLLAQPLSELTAETFKDNVSVDDINRVYEADSVYWTLKEIIEICGELGVSAGAIESSTIEEFKSIEEKINRRLDEVKGSIEQYKVWYSTQLMREFLGAENIDLAADVFSPSFFKVRSRKARSYSVQGLVTYYYDELADSNKLLTYIRSFSNQKDVTTQAFYNIVRQAKAKEAIDYNDRITQLIEIEKEWKELKRRGRIEYEDWTDDDERVIKTRRFEDLDLFERLDDGSLSGYFIGEYNWGQFHRDKQDVIAQVKKDFLRDLESGGVTSSGGHVVTMTDYRSLSKSQRYTLFSEYLEDTPYYQEFMDKAYEDRDAGVLSEHYKNHKFADLIEIPEFKAIYDKIIAYKDAIDSECLTDITSDEVGGTCHGVPMRIPQFSISKVQKIFGGNDKLITHKHLYDSRHTKEICTDVTSDYFGSPLTSAVAMKEEEDDFPPDLRKLALYGINMLDNPNDLSTDIFKSLELYTEMASRFHTSQGVVSKLELFHSQLDKGRSAAADIREGKEGNLKEDRVKTLATHSREKMLRNFIYAKNKSKWLKFGGFFGAFGAIRALCLSPIAGLKNYLAGYRVLVQDVAAGVLEGVTLKDVVRATLLNLSPVHLGGEICRVVTGETMSFDHYQKLVDRWDSYRTPGKIQRKKGFNVLQSMINVAMANYSTTDNALIGTIYHSKMKKVELYDVNSGKTISAADAYRWVNDNPQIKEGLLLRAEDAEKYRRLKSALSSVEDIIENNKHAEEDDSIEIMRFGDSVALQELENFYDLAGEEMPPIKNSDQTFKSAEIVEATLREAIRSICFNEDEEFKLCNNINDYIITSQGVYGILNATEFQSDMYTQSLGKIKGYMFGIAQRNFMTNYRASNKKVNHGLVNTVRLALFSVFSGAKEFAAAGDMTPMQYRLYAASMCVLPIARFNKNFRKHMHDCGWDDDQLNKLICAALGFWINFTLGALARMLFRGNEKRIGDKVYSAKGKMPLRDERLDGLIDLYTDARSRRLIREGVLFPDDAKHIDKKKAKQQYETWKKSGYLKNQRDPSEGKFKKGTKQFRDRVESFELKNVVYDSQDPMYWITGAGYRLLRGIRDEGVTLMNPIRFANDAMDMVNVGNSIALSAGLSTLLGGMHAVYGLATNDKDVWEQWRDREINFYLNKMGFNYDSKAKDVEYLDWYDKEEKIENYQGQRRSIPMPWI